MFSVFGIEVAFHLLPAGDPTPAWAEEDGGIMQKGWKPKNHGKLRSFLSQNDGKQLSGDSMLTQRQFFERILKGCMVSTKRGSQFAVCS